MIAGLRTDTMVLIFLINGIQTMTISIFELFSIGIGPSSSHTVGPMRAAKDFVVRLPHLEKIARLTVTLYGSLAFTGKGHGTPNAILMGLCGYEPKTINPEIIPQQVDEIQKNQILLLLQQQAISFDVTTDLIFNYQEKFDFHSNAMRLVAYDKQNQILDDAVYYSVGGGFIVRDSEKENDVIKRAAIVLPYPFNHADELLALCQKHQLTIAQIMLANEMVWRSEAEIREGLLQIAAVMEACIEKGLRTEGILEGRLKVVRRAPALYQKLLKEEKPGKNHHHSMYWLDVYAMAVNEENAAGGKVVTAPTNGAAGIIPAVMYFYKNFYEESSPEKIVDYLLTAGAIGILYKKNASISGAEMGCQGEVGVACSMAAGALTAVLGGTAKQVENAAEIGMEHNLGLTCDPVDERVQIPCIERNAMGAVKAVNAAQLALAGTGENKVSLDAVIRTMKEIGQNMDSMYKETSKGGLAVNVVEC